MDIKQSVHNFNEKIDNYFQTNKTWEKKDFKHHMSYFTVVIPLFVGLARGFGAVVEFFLPGKVKTLKDSSPETIQQPAQRITKTASVVWKAEDGSTVIGEAQVSYDDPDDETEPKVNLHSASLQSIPTSTKPSSLAWQNRQKINEELNAIKKRIKDLVEGGQIPDDNQSYKENIVLLNKKMYQKQDSTTFKEYVEEVLEVMQKLAGRTKALNPSKTRIEELMGKTSSEPTSQSHYVQNAYTSSSNTSSSSLTQEPENVEDEYLLDEDEYILEPENQTPPKQSKSDPAEQHVISTPKHTPVHLISEFKKRIEQFKETAGINEKSEIEKLDYIVDAYLNRKNTRIDGNVAFSGVASLIKSNRENALNLLGSIFSDYEAAENISYIKKQSPSALQEESSSSSSQFVAPNIESSAPTEVNSSEQNPWKELDAYVVRLKNAAKKDNAKYDETALDAIINEYKKSNINKEEARSQIDELIGSGLETQIQLSSFFNYFA